MVPSLWNPPQADSLGSRCPAETRSDQRALFPVASCHLSPHIHRPPPLRGWGRRQWGARAGNAGGSSAGLCPHTVGEDRAPCAGRCCATSHPLLSCPAGDPRTPPPHGPCYVPLQKSTCLHVHVRACAGIHVHPQKESKNTPASIIFLCKVLYEKKDEVCGGNKKRKNKKYFSLLALRLV